MKQNENTNWLDEVLSDNLKKNNDFDFQKWQDRFPDEIQQLREMRNVREKTKKISWHLIWRTIMKSPYTKYGTIAAALLIGTVFLFSDGIIPSSGILLADVQEKIFQQENCIISGSRTITTKEKEPETKKLTVKKYLSRKYGYVDQTFDEKGNLLVSLSVHHPSKSITVLFPQEKRYFKYPITEEYLEKLNEISFLKIFGVLFYKGDPEDLENIDVASWDITKIPGAQKRVIQGVEAVGFEITDLSERVSKQLGFRLLPLAFDMQQSRVSIWINPETLLPVRFEGEVDLGKCIMTKFVEQKLIEVNDRTKWNVEMDEKLFKPEIPEDYMLLGVPGIKKASVMGASATTAAVPLFILAKKRKKSARAAQQDKVKGADRS